jgi:hypothetical protein
MRTEDWAYAAEYALKKMSVMTLSPSALLRATSPILSREETSLKSPRDSPFQKGPFFPISN